NSNRPEPMVTSKKVMHGTWGNALRGWSQSSDHGIRKLRSRRLPTDIPGQVVALRVHLVDGVVLLAACSAFSEGIEHQHRRLHQRCWIRQALPCYVGGCSVYRFEDGVVIA